MDRQIEALTARVERLERALARGVARSFRPHRVIRGRSRGEPTDPTEGRVRGESHGAQPGHEGSGRGLCLQSNILFCGKVPRAAPVEGRGHDRGSGRAGRGRAGCAEGRRRAVQRPYGGRGRRAGNCPNVGLAMFYPGTRIDDRGGDHARLQQCGSRERAGVDRGLRGDSRGAADRTDRFSHPESKYSAGRAGSADALDAVWEEEGGSTTGFGRARGFCRSVR